MKKSLLKMFLKDNIKLFLTIILSIGLIVWVIQSVGFLDFVSEDGHGFKVYFSYSILNFPKILHRILPFIFFISLFYQITQYENNNELIIFWINGVKKIQFIHMILLYSFLFLLIQIFLGSYISPKGQDQARSFIRNSNMDFFPAMLKEEKFIDAVEKLTIYIDKKDNYGNYINIFLKEDMGAGDATKSKIIYAKKAKLISNDQERYFKFFDGKLINNDGEKTTVLDFETINFNLLSYDTKSTTFPKIQEVGSYLLFKCFFYKQENKVDIFLDDRLGCNDASMNEINQELLKRFYMPIYLPLIALIISLIVIKSKENKNYINFKLLLFFLIFLTIIVSEISLRYSTINKFGFLFFISFPVLSFITIYLSLIKKFKSIV